jgi:MFS family permease
MTPPWLALTVTTGIQALVAMAVLTLPVMAPAAAPALGISATYTGLYVSLVYVGAMLASLAAGNAVAKFGAIRVSQGGLLLCAAGLCLSALPSLPAVAVGAVLVGLGYGPITPASSHLLARTTPRERMSVVFSIKQTGVPLGGVLAGAIVPGLMLWTGWQGALLAVAAANVLCAVLAQPLRVQLDDDRDASKRLALGSLTGPLRLILSHPGLRMLAGCSFVFAITQLSLTSYLVTFLDGTLAYGLVTAGLTLSAAQAGGVVGRVLWGYVSDHWLGAGRMLASLSLLMAAAAFATALLHPGLPVLLVVAVLVVFGASAIGWNGVYLAEVARRAPAGQVSLATGGTLAITFFGVVLGPPAFGAVSALFGTYRAGFFALAIACALCTLALVRVQRRAPATRPA